MLGKALYCMQGDKTLLALLDIEDNKQDSPFERLHLIKEQMLNRHIKTRCTGGYEIYKTMLCGTSFLEHGLLWNETLCSMLNNYTAF